MSTPSHVGSTPWPEDFQRWIPDGAAKPVPVAIAFFLLVLTWLSLDRSQSHLRDLPLVNPPKSLLQSTSEIKVRPSRSFPSAASYEALTPNF